LICFAAIGERRTAPRANLTLPGTRLKSRKKEIWLSSAAAVFRTTINLIQAHKALETAARACSDGGRIIFLAECADASEDEIFSIGFGARDSNDLAAKLCEKYQVNGQTAWSLLRKAEQFDVQIVTSLAESETRLMRMQRARDLENALSKINSDTNGYILPFGAKFLIKEKIY
jgi:nickel-dependent lactate racemase